MVGCRNPRVTCSNIPVVDLSPWKDRAACSVGERAIDIGDTQHISPCTTCTCTKEGPLCQSVKVSNCFQLSQQFTSQAVLEDSVCKVQCAFIFRAVQEFSEPLDNNQLGFSQVLVICESNLLYRCTYLFSVEKYAVNLILKPYNIYCFNIKQILSFVPLEYNKNCIIYRSEMPLIILKGFSVVFLLAPSSYLLLFLHKICKFLLIFKMCNIRLFF